MAIQNYPKKWSSKPPLGTQINWGHPLAYGLIGCWLFNEGAGSSITDMATKQVASLNAFVSPNWVSSLLGIVARCPNLTASNWYKQIAVTVPFPATIVSIFAIAGIGAANGSTLFRIADASELTTGYGMSFSPASPTVLDLILTQVGTFAFSSLTIASGNSDVFYFAAITVDKNAGTANGYLAPLGTPLATQAITPGTIAAGAMTNIFLNDSPAGNPINGSVSQTMFYNRVLTPSELNWLNIDPYAFMAPMSPARRQNKQLTAAAGGVTTPLRMRMGMGV